MNIKTILLMLPVILLIAAATYFSLLPQLLLLLVGFIVLFLLIRNDKVLLIGTVYVFVLDSGNGLFPIPLRELLFGLLVLKTIYYILAKKVHIKYFTPFLIISFILPIYGVAISQFRGQNLSYAIDDAKGYIFLITGLCIYALISLKTVLKKSLLNHFLIACLTVSIGTILILALELTNIVWIYDSSVWLINHNLGFAGLEINGQYRVFIRSQLYVMLGLILISTKIMSRSHNKMDYTILLIFSVCILISNTRGLWLGSILGVSIMLLFGKSTVIKVISACVIILSITLTPLFFSDFTGDVLERVSSSFDFTQNESNSIRSEQALQLVNEFENHIFFGKGFGSTLDTGYYRSEVPYSFELSYLELLYKLGLFGFIPFVIGLLLYFRIIIKSANKDMKLGVFASFFSFILLSTTNPYIVSSLGMFFLAILFSLTTNSDNKQPGLS
ncbi:O-antigen ligase family protein [Mesobacillus subterraneus]|uniref:O-antigen ligase family protein n=1 Tax=Mesobacillus subterraneus TaxID=285983 RepID=UPI00204071C3|nr:O-antigen ligase family protein [Mesobacillus subterraneus]MCM3573274.1 O-antigen ligase family protein [Mesobacillus subterraneus]